MTIKILLNEDDFTKLISGKIIKQFDGDVEIMLKDIGYQQMIDIIRDKFQELMDAF